MNLLDKNLKQHSMKKFLLVFFYCVSTILLSGCWDRVEVNDLAIVTAAAFDKKEDNQIEVTLQLFAPKSLSSGGGQGGGGGGGGNKITYTASDSGKNIADAVSKLQGKLPREIFWGQCKVFIFGEDLAKQGIRGQIDFLLRHPEPREASYIFVGEGKAKVYLDLVPNLERYSAEVIREISNQRVGMQITMKDLDVMLTGFSQAAAIPYLRVGKQKKSDGKTIKYIYIDGSAVFRKDQMIETISESETRGILWLRDEVKGYTISVKIEDEEGLVSLNPVSARVKLIPQIHQDQWKMIVNIDTEGTMVQNETILDFSDPILLKKVERAYQKVIEDRIQEVLKHVQQELKVDVLDFAEIFYRKYPKQLKAVENRWENQFSKVDVDINVQAHIRREGYINAPAAMPAKEVKE